MKPITNSEELEEAILLYNLKYKGKWKFHLLHSFFDEVNLFFLFFKLVITSILVNVCIPYIINKLIEQNKKSTQLFTNN